MQIRIGNLKLKKWRDLPKANQNAVIYTGLAALIALSIGISGTTLYHQHAHANNIKTEAVLDIEHPNLNQVNHSATPGTKNAFVKKIGAAAVNDFQNDHDKVLPSVVIAQAIVESEWGQSELYLDGNNVFGVKTGPDYRGPYVTFKTREVVNGNNEIVNARFRKYSSIEASISDHNKLVYNNFLNRKKIMNYAKVANILHTHNPAYATDPNYAKTLISVIKTYHLNKYDIEALK